MVACGQACTDVLRDPGRCGGCDQPCAAPLNAVPLCVNGACGWTCQAGFVQCGADCADIQSEVAHCGACGQACSAPDATRVSLCQQGVCTSVCREGFADCDGECVDVSVVESAQEAGLGELTPCAAVAALRELGAGLLCAVGLSICDARCVDMATDDDHCGACGNRCRGNRDCHDGQCVKRSN
jgi:hypothetical protein